MAYKGQLTICYSPTTLVPEQFQAEAAFYTGTLQTPEVYILSPTNPLWASTFIDPMDTTQSGSGDYTYLPVIQTPDLAILTPDKVKIGKS
jgi:hypothetical protein